MANEIYETVDFESMPIKEYYAELISRLANEVKHEMLYNNTRLGGALINIVHPQVQAKTADGSTYIDREGHAHVGGVIKTYMVVQFSNHWPAHESLDDMQKVERAVTEDVRFYFRKNVNLFATSVEMAKLIELMSV